MSNRSAFSLRSALETPLGAGLKRARPVLFALFSLSLFALALIVLRRELTGVHLSDVLGRFSALGPPALGMALLFTGASYVALAGYDLLALRHIGRSLPLPRVALTSFIATAVGHNLGVAMLSGGAVRMRMYTAAGLSATETTAVVAVVGLTFGIGVTLVAALVLALAPAQAASLLHLSDGLARGIGLLVLAVLGLYLLWGALRRAPLRLGVWEIRLPTVTTSLGQIALAALDLGCAAAALYALLSGDVAPPFLAFLSVYVLAIVAGIASHVPGGVGVFETVLVLGLPSVPKDDLLAAVLVYRLIYYLLPLGIAVLLAAVHELHLQHRHIARGLEMAQDALEGVVPQVMAVAVFVAGAVLLFSGATPGSSDRMALLEAWVPLPLLELSHLAGSLVGLGLVVLAGGLYRRLNGAHHLALGMLIVGAVASILKGLDWEEALLAGLAALALWSGRAAFYRRSLLWEQRLTPGWIAAVALALGGSIWLGLFAFKRVEYVNDLWWQFAFDADAPRFLRATVVVVTAATALGLMRLLRAAPPPPGLPNAEELRRAERLVNASPSADAALVLLGDKRILFDEEDRGFLMFQIRGRSWIAMGDPVGPLEVAESLAWRFRDLCDQYGGRPVFYQVDPEHLPLYLDLGLAPLKIGEAGVVDLTHFSLQGSTRSKLRQSHRKVVKTGIRFGVMAAEALDDALMGELKSVSDAWLAAKKTREKGFSVGRFSPDYLRHFPIAVARQDGRLLAFANLWTAGDRSELSIDLMRHLPEAPNGVMDFLFVELMLWGAAQGFRRFNLGMAPLSGLETRPLAPLWHRIGTLTFRHGENFYNFQGLRAYKEKFLPEWTPKYLALPRGATLPRVLLDLSALIAGSARGIVAR